MWDIVKPSRRHPRAGGGDRNGALRGGGSGVSRASYDIPYRRTARTYPKTPAMRLNGFLSVQLGISSCDQEIQALSITN